jgi:hypothetical protein
VDSLAITVTGTLTTEVAKEILAAIKGFLSKKKASEKEIVELKQNLGKLVELSTNSSLALSQYVSLNRASAEASVHCTELTRLLKDIPPKDLDEQFDKFITVRIQDHLQEGVEAIHSYQEDYEQALNHYQRVERYAKDARERFASDIKSSCEKMEEANEELNSLSKIGKRKVDKLLQDLQAAYKVLGKIA